ncbi:unnamed protein product [Adineta steineri]|uniref:Uncharacterized protein n=1 Tax=Adineta steineri TaxID=433720 RepID=A0A815IAH7_9BILA|nr:unnamed protein product [Adineta steineri]CAF3889763.1 unnamed protein product [Adineta steineri]
MACCGLCRPKVKATNKINKNITSKKINRISMWIENIEGPYEPIILPSKSLDEPKIITNKEEISENNSKSNRNMQNRKHNLQYLSSQLSINEEIQSALSDI